MVRTQKVRKDLSHRIKYFRLPIGLRLSLAFMVIILLTGLIGILAIRQITSLTSAATEINARDLPEAITLVHLYSQLYQQRDLELSLVNNSSGDSSEASPQQSKQTRQNLETPTSDHASKPPAGSHKQTQQQIVFELLEVLKSIDGDCQRLLAFEKTEPNDFPLMQNIVNDVSRTRALSVQMLDLIKHEQITQARAIDLGQQQPLQMTTIATIAQFEKTEQVEDAHDSAQMQLESEQSTLFVVILTALCLLLSILLAIIITRSLTRPLKVLLHTTEAIASGDLTVETQVESTDEIGRLATAYDKMRVSLRATIESLRLERQQTQAIIDAIADGVILLDGAYKILKCNPAAAHLSGWRASEAIGKYCWEVLGFHEKTEAKYELLSPLMVALQTRSEQSYLEMPIVARSGQQRWLAISCAPMSSPEEATEQQLVIGLHDISQLKAVEQMKSDFVAMVSHELRAPLTTVTGSVEMLGLLDSASDPDTYHEVLSILDQQTRRLCRVVEEVLQLTRFETGRLEVHLQPLSITHFLRNLVENIHTDWTNNDRSITFLEPAEEILAWADEGLLEIVFRNLLDNARKYTPLGSTIELETESAPTSGQVHIRVIDQGSGIPEDQLEHIFERFSRGTQSSYHWSRGYGLGLYIARELMQAHSGTIRAENRPQGACFELSLWMVSNDRISHLLEEE
jgi:PAS domain S-box-containing protein